MSEEIKEILNEIKIVIDYNEIQNIYRTADLDYNDGKLLLNYITNLQKENENLKQQLDFIDEQNKHIDKIEKMIKDYKQRNEKAIEWCECVVNAKYTADKLPNGKTTDMGYCLDLAEPLLNILNGGDE